MAIDGERRPSSNGPRSNPPAFNVPGIVLASILAFAAVHLVRTTVLGSAGDERVLLDFAFIPGCYVADTGFCLFRSPGAGLWTPLTYAFLHGDWMHLATNTVWLLAFGTPVARRIGALRFVIFSAVGAVAGAALFDLLNPTLLLPVIGASGIVSALMGGACRFAFTAPGRLHSRSLASVPLMPIGRALANRTVLFFIIVFFATNLAIGSGVGGFLGGGEVAWEAHLGGFAFGFLFFQLFDRHSGRERQSRP